ncbi:MAG: hypothetical protein JO335_00935 [Sphingomonas sp.]|nr:hypothetical protein [Sphingomonas sp.]
MADYMTMPQLNSALMQLQGELEASFTTIISLQALSSSVTHQQIARAFDLGDEWAADRLEELSATVSRECHKYKKPQFAEAYAAKLAALAGQLRSREGPTLVLIEGGKTEPEGE